MSDHSTALVVAEQRGILSIDLDIATAQMAKQMEGLRKLKESVLHEGEDYGTIPGTDKPTLLKPGAEKMGMLFQVTQGEPQVTERDLPGGHREYRVLSPMIHRTTGTCLGYGFGLCSSMESKYRYRRGEPETTGQPVPPSYWAAKESAGNDKNGWKKAAEAIGGRDFMAKKNPDTGRWEIYRKSAERLENPDLADSFNTVLKMASKRSYIDGILKATGSSVFFTQDLDDAPAAAEESGPAPQASRAAPPPRSPPAAEPAFVSVRGFPDYVALVNSDQVPQKDRPAWMQKAKGGKDAALLEALAAEIRTTYSGASAAAKGSDALRVEIMEYINTIVPEADRPPLRADLQEIPDEQLAQAKSELQARYGI
jgi:hypothetical protein